MSRTVSAAIETGLNEHVTAPSYLVELVLDVPVYLTTMDNVTWNGRNWVAAATEVQRLTERGGRIVLRNDDNAGSSLVLNNATRDKEAIVYLYYNGDATEVFRGYIGDANISPMKVTLDVVVNRADRAVAPRGRIVAPVFTRILAPGAVIRWANQILRVR